MAKTKETASFTLQGIKYVDIPYYKSGDAYYVGVVGTAKMIRQYLKAKYPRYKAWVKSESFSMGNSINVNLNRIPESDYKEINSYLGRFQEGYFDGMTDSYNYTKKAEMTDEGFKVDYGAKYVFVSNQPPHGTPEYNEPAPNYAEPVAASEPEKPVKPTQQSEFVFTCAGWDMNRVQITVKGIQKQVFKLKKKKETPSNRELWGEIKGALLQFGLKWNKFGQSFDRFLEGDTFPNSDELCKVLEKYYGGATTTASPAITEPVRQVGYYEVLGYPNEKAWLVRYVKPKSQGDILEVYCFEEKSQDFTFLVDSKTSSELKEEILNHTTKPGTFYFLVDKDGAIKAATGELKPLSLYIKYADNNYDQNADPLKIGQRYETYVGLWPTDVNQTKDIRLLYVRIRWAEGYSDYVDKYPLMFNSFEGATKYIKMNMAAPEGGYDKHGVDWLWSNGDWGDVRWDVNRGMYQYDNFWEYDHFSERFYDTITAPHPADSEYVEYWMTWYKQRQKTSLGISKDSLEKLANDVSKSSHWQKQSGMSADEIVTYIMNAWSELFLWLSPESAQPYNRENKIKAYEVLLRMEQNTSERNRIEQIIRALKLI